MKLQDRFQLISKRMALDFEEAGLGKHAGTKGANREHKLAEFLAEKLPTQYGIASGEVVFRDGSLSNQTDVIVYDCLRSPVLYSEASQIVPIDGTFGIIEVKSFLSKEELLDAARKIKAFKEQAPRDLAILRKPEHMTFVRPGRPFGIAFGYSLKDNSLESLARNWMEINHEIGVVNNWINMIAVLGQGLVVLFRRKEDGSPEPLLETDALVNFTLAAQEGKNDGNVAAIPLAFGENSLLYFYFYLNAMLARTQIAPVDIGRYIDPRLPPIIHSVL